MATSDVLTELSKKALKDGIIGGVITLKRTAPDAAVHALITDMEMLEDVDSMIPYFPDNCANFIKRITKVAPPNKPILAILKPCEMRAVVELVKLVQIQNKNIIYATFDCYGTIARKDLKDKEIPKSQEFIKSVSDGKFELREICKSCDYIRSETADISYLTFEKDTLIVAQTETGKNFLEKLEVQFVESAPDKGLQSVLDMKLKAKTALYENLKSECSGTDNIFKTFAHCINCHNCMTNCPICICKECFFESDAMDFEGDVFLDLASRKGGLRAPTDVMLFHIGRMAHMATSCVACGACEEACPEDIIVGQIFKWISENVQSIFEYRSGRDWEEELPLKTFREEELEPK